MRVIENVVPAWNNDSWLPLHGSSWKARLYCSQRGRELEAECTLSALIAKVDGFSGATLIESMRNQERSREGIT